MKTMSLLIASALCLAGPAFAQTTAPAAPATPAPAAAAPAAPAATPAPDTGMTKDGKPRMKVVRAQCKDEIKGQSLKGDARKQAMAACIVKERPDMEAKIKCQMDPSLKGMAKDAKKDAVKACVAKAKT